MNEASSTFGCPTIMFSSVGIYARAKLMDTEIALLDKIMAINVKSALLPCKAVILQMQVAGGGSFILSQQIATEGWAMLSTMCMRKPGWFRWINAYRPERSLSSRSRQEKALPSISSYQKNPAERAQFSVAHQTDGVWHAKQCFKCVSYEKR